MTRATSAAAVALLMMAGQALAAPACQNSGSFITHLMYIFDGTAQQAVATFVVNHVR